MKCADRQGRSHCLAFRDQERLDLRHAPAGRVPVGFDNGLEDGHARKWPVVDGAGVQYLDFHVDGDHSQVPLRSRGRRQFEERAVSQCDGEPMRGVGTRRTSLAMLLDH